MKRGFTLIEVLVYIAVFSIIIGSVSALLITTLYSQIKAKAMREALDNGQRAMEKMVYEIKEAKNIYIPTTTANQLSLETAHYLPVGEETTYIDFYFCSNRLCLKKESQNPTSLTSEKVEIINLSFAPIFTGKAASVQINLSLKYKNPSNRPEYQASANLQSTASLKVY